MILYSSFLHKIYLWSISLCSFVTYGKIGFAHPVVQFFIKISTLWFLSSFESSGNEADSIYILEDAGIPELAHFSGLFGVSFTFPNGFLADFGHSPNLSLWLLNSQGVRFKMLSFGLISLNLSDFSSSRSSMNCFFCLSLDSDLDSLLSLKDGPWGCSLWELMLLVMRLWESFADVRDSVSRNLLTRVESWLRGLVPEIFLACLKTWTVWRKGLF